MTQKLTISQGLRQLKKLRGQYTELKTRGATSLSWKAGSPPAFDFDETVKKLDSVRSEIVSLESRVAIANATTRVIYNGVPVNLVSLVRTLQELKGEISWYKDLICRSHSESTEDDIDWGDDGKRVRVQTTWKCAFPEATRASKVESLQAVFDELNDLVERTNHSTVMDG